MRKTTILSMVETALFAAILCIVGPLSVPIGPVPISLTNFIIYIAVYVLATKEATLSVIVYLLLGMVGLPVFSGFSGGMTKLAGPTGGYLIGFIFIALISGFVKKKCNCNLIITVIAMIISTVITYAFGTVWFMYSMKMGLVESLGLCVFPFIPGDLLKIALATVLGKAIRIPLAKAGLLKD